MTIEDDIAFLERVPALAILGRDALRILAIGTENRYVHEGVTLFAEGEQADGAYVVQEGSFDLVSRDNGTADASVGPGTLIGEVALISETRRPVSAVAREPSSVVRIPRQLFLKMLESDPDAARAHARRARGTRQSDGRRIRPRARRAGGRTAAQVNRRGRGRAAASGAENPGARIRRGDRSRTRQQGLAQRRARERPRGSRSSPMCGMSSPITTSC